jgi:hypothetical protein
MFVHTTYHLTLLTTRYNISPLTENGKPSTGSLQASTLLYQATFFPCANHFLPFCFLLVSCLAYSLTLKIEAVFSSKTLDFYKLDGITNQKIIVVRTQIQHYVHGCTESALPKVTEVNTLRNVNINITNTCLITATML